MVIKMASEIVCSYCHYNKYYYTFYLHGLSVLHYICDKLGCIEKAWAHYRDDKQYDNWLPENKIKNFDDFHASLEKEREVKIKNDLLAVNQPEIEKQSSQKIMGNRFETVLDIKIPLDQIGICIFKYLLFGMLLANEIEVFGIKSHPGNPNKMVVSCNKIISKELGDIITTKIVDHWNDPIFE